MNHSFTRFNFSWALFALITISSHFALAERNPKQTAEFLGLRIAEEAYGRCQVLDSQLTNSTPDREIPTCESARCSYYFVDLRCRKKSEVRIHVGIYDLHDDYFRPFYGREVFSLRAK